MGVVLDSDSAINEDIQNIFNLNLDQMDQSDESNADYVMWNEVDPDIHTQKGRALQKRCLSVVGRSLCVCEYKDGLMISGQSKHKHLCYTPHGKDSVTKKTIQLLAAKDREIKRLRMK